MYEEKKSAIRVPQDVVVRLKLVSKLRKNGETQGALIGNLLDAELARLGYKYKGTAIGTN